jgi:DNA-binding transcriptional MerR regulator
MSVTEQREDLFPIRELSRLTGVNTVTLRAWERRHGLLKPQRTSKGHRLYSASDVARVKQIQAWLIRGLAISQVRKVLDSGMPPSEEVHAVADKTWNQFTAEVMAALNQLNRAKLEAIIDNITANYPVELFADRLLAPLQEQLRRNQRLGMDVQLAFLQAVASEILLYRQHPLRQGVTGAAVLLIKLNAQESDLMPQVLSYSILQKQIDVNYMGYMAPASWASAAAVLKPAAVILYADAAADMNFIQEGLQDWQQSLNMPLWIAGAVTPVCAAYGSADVQPVLLGDRHQFVVTELSNRLREGAHDHAGLVSQ